MASRDSEHPKLYIYPKPTPPKTYHSLNPQSQPQNALNGAPNFPKDPFVGWPWLSERPRQRLLHAPTRPLPGAPGAMAVSASADL